MEIIENFGIDPVLLAAQIVNILIILAVLRKFVYGPVLEILNKRKQTVEKGLKDAEESRILLEKAEEKEREIITDAQQQAKRIIDDAKKQAFGEADQIKESAKKQTDKMLQDARAQIEQETKEAESKLSTKINDLSIGLLTKTLSDLFGEKEEKQLLQKAIKQIKKAD